MYKNLFIILVLLCSCKQQRTDNPLLNGNQYTLWYLKESGNENPKFLYIDCYKKFSVLSFDIHTGSFFPISENSIAGKWKYDSDTSIYLNDIVYSITTCCDTFTYESYDIWYTAFGETVYYNDYLKVLCLQSQSTKDALVLRETRFPIDLHTDIKHYEKWRKRIKKSPILDGWDYKLWHWGTEKDEDNHTYEYYDKYGKKGLVYLYTHNGAWYFSNPYDAELISAEKWYQNKDTIYTQSNFKYTVLNKGKQNDTLRLININSGIERILIDTNITPKR